MNDSSTPIGVTFGSLSVLGPRAIIDIAKRAAQLRYRSLWTVEATGTDAFTCWVPPRPLLRTSTSRPASYRFSCARRRSRRCRLHRCRR